MLVPAIPENITGLVLAGGRGSRMGGVDKGLLSLDQRPLVDHVLQRLAPQVNGLMISANRNIERYAQFGHPLVPDQLADFAGPLAGLEAGMQRCPTPYLVSVPCDSPFFPLDLVKRLAEALSAERASIAVAKTGERLHPVFCLMRTFSLPDLQAFTSAGGRRMELWLKRLKWVACPFDDVPEAFVNINTPEQLRAHQTGEPIP